MGRWLTITLWLALIFYTSSIAAGPSPTPTLISFLQAKAGHILEYAILGWMLQRALVTPAAGLGFRPRWALFATLALGVCFAALDETRQHFVYSRTGAPSDVLIDAASVLGGALLSQRGLRLNRGTSQAGEPRRQMREQPTGKNEHQELHREDLSVAVDVGHERHHDHQMDRDEDVQQGRPERPARR
jgi:VanZ family protein